MYKVENAEVDRAIRSPNPLYGLILEHKSTGKQYAGECLFSAETETASTTLSDDIELGAICSQSLSVKLTGAKNTSFLGEKFKMYIYLRNRFGITYDELRPYTFSQLSGMTVNEIVRLNEILCNEHIPLGEFTCVKHKKNGDISELELYDRLYFSDSKYECSVNLPASSRAIEDDICSQIGCENGNNFNEAAYLIEANSKDVYDKNGNRIKTGSFVFEITAIPEDCTKRQMLSYIAAANGQFGFINRHGQYVRKWYSMAQRTVTQNTIDEPTVSEKANSIIGIICHVPSLSGGDTLTLTIGNTDKTQGRVLEFENPYITAVLLNSLFVKTGGFSWYTAEVNQRLGDPRFDLGDVINYADINSRTVCSIPITKLKFKYSGGFSAEISAVGLTGEELL